MTALLGVFTKQYRERFTAGGFAMPGATALGENTKRGEKNIHPRNLTALLGVFTKQYRGRFRKARRDSAW